ncbi:hypothetical protein T440DRAFT_182121 [Plenodomus tracheiphilus IPT5]|uniref:Uncharacterized protein n=1 Tax=Plenodomus tracheiphilus IPT5 TaxID=1408161 RepID=A0A6A7B068_9PLEO|nr:hypothetical protein T440DRAFT_182121 [Plenodomus tracheiphilus IPT5]
MKYRRNGVHQAKQNLTCCVLCTSWVIRCAKLSHTSSCRSSKCAIYSLIRTRRTPARTGNIRRKLLMTALGAIGWKRSSSRVRIDKLRFVAKMSHGFALHHRSPYVMGERPRRIHKPHRKPRSAAGHTWLGSTKSTINVGFETESNSPNMVSFASAV